MPGDPLGAGDLVLRTSVTAEPSGGSAGANKLWLPLWSGEVINAYDQYNIFENVITNKTLSGGFSYEFPVTGTVALNAAWDAGEELIGGDSSSTTFKVNLDKRPMAAHFETDNVDLLVTQWDYRSELARQAGLTLANTRDRQIAMALLAACAVPVLSSDPRGLVTASLPVPGVVGTGAASAAADQEALNILKEIENYLVQMQENDFPVNNVYCAVTPKVFQVIRALGIPRTAATAGEFQRYPLFGASEEVGGLGAPLAVGMNMLSDSLDYMGVKIIKTNHLPNTDVSATAGAAIGGTKYNLNASGIKLHGIIFQPEAVAGLSLMGMKVDTVQDVRRNTQFTVASMMKGTGILRPELCKALVGATTAADLDTRAELFTLLDNTTVGTNNLTSGFFAEYKVTT